MSENQSNYFFWYKADFEEAVKRHVCSKCVDMTADGVCYSKDPKGCALFRYLPQLVMIAQHLNNPKLEDYIQTVREKIGMTCHNPDTAARCQWRDTLDCGLDCYLPLVLEAIEETNAMLEERARLAIC